MTTKGGAYSAAFNNAVRTAYRAGVLSVVASGNENADASFGSPSSAPEAITVGAINSAWREADFSNWGPAVDILAPGEQIESAWIGGNDASEVLDGTSMATPHVVGLALYLVAAEGISSVDELSERIKGLGTSGEVKGVKLGSPDLVAFNGVE